MVNECVWFFLLAYDVPMIVPVNRYYVNDRFSELFERGVTVSKDRIDLCTSFAGACSKRLLQTATTFSSIDLGRSKRAGWK